MWSLLASLPTEAPQTVGLSSDLPYGLLIGLLGAGLQLAVGEVWRLVASDPSQQPDPFLALRHRLAAGQWQP